MSRAEKPTITETTRRDIADFFAIERISWSGRMEEPAFLGRLWDLSSLPTRDSRFRNAGWDIWQHRVNNYDWDDDWIFTDDRFDLMYGPDDVYVRFLCETLHPAVRSDEDEARALARALNERLAKDDWELVEVRHISGRPIFEGRRREGFQQPSDVLDASAYPRLSDPQVLRDHLRRIDRDLNSDPAGAIGASKELLETVLKLILDDFGTPYKPRDDIMELYKLVQRQLALNADAVPGSSRGSEAAVKTLRALVNTVNSLTELRNAVGSGHGRSQSSPALTRHARLAFNATVTVTEFLLDTWHVRLSDAN